MLRLKDSLAFYSAVAALGVFLNVAGLFSTRKTYAQSDTTIDLMLVYTPEFRRNAEKSQQGLEGLIDELMQSAQQVLDNTDTLTRLRLVHTGEVFSYMEADTRVEDLNRLSSPHDGHMDEIHEWRDQYGADLVALLCWGFAGNGYQLTTAVGNFGYGFSAVGVETLNDIPDVAMTFIHEIGHNLGCHHSVHQRDLSGPGLFPYSAGWYFTGESGEKYATIMAYDADGYGNFYTPLPMFSSPEVYHDNTPAGDAWQGDNTRTIQQTAPVVGDYRHAKPAHLALYPLQIPLFSGPEKGPMEPETANFQIQNHGTDPVTWQVAVEDSWISVQPMLGSLSPDQKDGIEISLNTETMYLPPGSHSTRLVFTNLNTGQTIQRVIVLDIQALPSPLCQALNNCQLDFQTGGDQPWTIQINGAADGGDAVRSGTIDHSQKSWIETSVTGPGSLSFQWKVSSEQDFDIFSFSINGETEAQVSGTVDWSAKTYELPEGEQALRWSYTKDRAFSGGLDLAFLDIVTWSGGTSSDEPPQDIKTADQLFDWLENQLPDLLIPRAQTQSLPGSILFRYYSLHNLYVGILQENLHYLDAQGHLFDLGPVSNWLEKI